MPSINNVKVLVIEPPNQHYANDMARPNGSLGPAYIVGALREQGIAADYIDGTIGSVDGDFKATFYNAVEQENGTVRYGMTPDELAELIAGYDVVATSSTFTLQTRMHFEIASIAKKVAVDRGQPILVVSGGVNARALYPHFLANGFDVVALGDGERTIVEVVQEFCRPNPDFANLDGVVTKQWEEIVVKPVVETNNLSNIDHLPFPAWESLPLDAYRDLGVIWSGARMPGVTFAPFQTSRGCQDKCTFCHISMEKLQTDLLGRIGFLRGFSNERIAHDLQKASDLGISYLYFADDNLFYNKSRLMELAPIFQREGMRYGNPNGVNIRFLLKKDSSGATVVDTEFIEMLAGFGLEQLSLPLESRNVEIMQKYASGKYNPDTMDTLAIVRALKKVGIQLEGGFMIGFRDETWESVLRTKEFARQVRAEGMDRVGFMIPVPYPGSLDFETVMSDASLREDFDNNVLKYTDRMHTRHLPLFDTIIPGEKLVEAQHDFWLELNDSEYTKIKLLENVSP